MSDYTDRMAKACRENQYLWKQTGKVARAQWIMRLARECGPALLDFEPTDREPVPGDIWARCIVPNCQDRLGTGGVTEAEFIAAMWGSVERYQQLWPTRRS